MCVGAKNEKRECNQSAWSASDLREAMSLAGEFLIGELKTESWQFNDKPQAYTLLNTKPLLVPHEVGDLTKEGLQVQGNRAGDVGFHHRFVHQL